MGVQMFSCAFLILVLFFSNVMFGINLVSAQCVQNQKDLLLELKNNLTYDHSLSTKLVQWNESIDCCEWVGVKCDSRGRVAGLDLSNETISGGVDDNATSLFKLEFLQSLNLAQNNFSVQFPSGFGRLAGLNYLNLSSSNFSGQIPVEFSNLTRLVVLDLSSSYFPSIEFAFSSYSRLGLENPDLKTLIHNFTQLRELYLDWVNISANGYQWCNAVSSSLPNLRVLSLSSTLITGPFDHSLVKLQSLSVIRLHFNTFSSPFPEFFTDFPSLKILTLRFCNLSGVTPGRLFQITSLQTIDLTWNIFLEGSLPEFPSNGSLQKLLVGNTNFSGNVHESIGNLKMLSQIQLYSCRFSGSIPKSIGNLTQLTELSLYNNRFTGKISDSHWERLESLVSLDLSGNSLEGEIPSSLIVLPSLKTLHLNNNRFYGSLRELTNGSSYSLEELDLSENNLGGPIPHFLFELHNLTVLFLSRNKFNGSLDLNDFRKLSNLENLDLSYNSLSVFIKENVSMSLWLPQLRTLALASCHLQEFPPLQNVSSSLKSLDFAENKLYGEIPNWIWELGNGTLENLNLSHNQFIGMEEPYDISSSMKYLDLHSNMLGGRIPVLPPTPRLVDFSNNNFSTCLPENIGNSLNFSLLFSIANSSISGNIPPSLCNARNMRLLDLSYNNLHGRIPSCLVGKTLGVLNLRRNNLSGNIPDIFPVTCGLETLDLSWNNLQGQVPISLSRCSYIKVLNLGHNNLHDAFPCSFRNLSELRVLDLSSNNFRGNISCMHDDNSTWPNLQIINLASNEFNGVLPRNLFQNMKTLMADVNGPQSQLDYLNSFYYSSYIDSQSVATIYHEDSVTVASKGLDLDLDKISTIFTSIDFSNNHFEGIIPETIGELKSLYVLNLSHNALSGHIPSSVEKLHKLGSLDLSSNHLNGEIPQQLVSLTLLEFLNLSHNDLVGRIPQGNQMNTFSESSFQGNKGLCGFPLNISCGPEVQQRESDEEHESTDNRGIYISAELGFIVGLGVMYMPLLFSSRWRRYFNKHLNNFLLFVLRRRR